MKINLAKVKSVKEFVAIAENKKCDVLIKSGNWCINGKSILGIFSLDLSNPVELFCDDLSGFEKFKA